MPRGRQQPGAAIKQNVWPAAAALQAAIRAALHALPLRHRWSACCCCPPPAFAPGSQLLGCLAFLHTLLLPASFPPPPACAPGSQLLVAALACRISSREYKPGSTPTCGSKEIALQASEKGLQSNHLQACRSSSGSSSSSSSSQAAAGNPLNPLRHCCPQEAATSIHKCSAAIGAHLCPAANAVCHAHGKPSVANEVGILPSPVRLGRVRDHASPRLKHQPGHERSQPASMGACAKQHGQRQQACSRGLTTANQLAAAGRQTIMAEQWCQKQQWHKLQPVHARPASRRG